MTKLVLALLVAHGNLALADDLTSVERVMAPRSIVEPPHDQLQVRPERVWCSLDEHRLSVEQRDDIAGDQMLNAHCLFGHRYGTAFQ